MVSNFIFVTLVTTIKLAWGTDIPWGEKRSVIAQKWVQSGGILRITLHTMTSPVRRDSKNHAPHYDDPRLDCHINPARCTLHIWFPESNSTVLGVLFVSHFTCGGYDYGKFPTTTGQRYVETDCITLKLTLQTLYTYSCNHNSRHVTSHVTLLRQTWDTI